MTGRVAGKVAFITGAARGQGRAHAVRLAEEGADIIGIDICRDIASVDYPLGTAEELAETKVLVEKHGRQMVTGIADVRDATALKATLDRGVATLGRLDCVLANAGIMPTWGAAANTMRAWQDCLDVLLTGVLNTVELTYPILRDQGTGGSIIMISSMAAVRPVMRTESGHTLGLLGYSAAKTALVSLVKNYASFLGAHEIRVNAIQPAGVDTPMIDNDMVRQRWEHASPEDLKCLVPAMPAGRMNPSEISNAVLWLCSDESHYYTGSTMRIDAGASLR